MPLNSFAVSRCPSLTSPLLLPSQPSFDISLSRIRICIHVYHLFCLCLYVHSHLCIASYALIIKVLPSLYLSLLIHISVHLSKIPQHMLPPPEIHQIEKLSFLNTDPNWTKFRFESVLSDSMKSEFSRFDGFWRG